MKLHATTGGKAKEYKDPKTFGEADRRLIELDTDIKLIDAQLSDPDMKANRSHKSYQAWRTKALRAKARKLHDYKLIKLWKREEEGRLRERLLRLEGLDDPKDPLCVLVHLHNTTVSMIKLLELQDLVTDSQWRVINQARELAMEKGHGR